MFHQYGVKNKTAFDNQYKIYLSQKIVYEWQQNAFFPQAKQDKNETLLNLFEVDDVDLNFLDELKTQISPNGIVVENTVVDSTSSEKIKNKKRKRVLTDEKIKKRNKKKKKLEKKFKENKKKGNNKR